MSLPQPTGEPSLERIATLKRSMKTALNQIRYINDCSKSALQKPSDIPAFKGAFKSLDRYYMQYENAYDELVVIHESIRSEEFPTESDSSNMNAVRKCYYQTCTNFENVHSACNKSTSSQIAQEGNITISNEPRVELPRIEVPKFDGRLLNWPKFRDTFSSMIHREDSIPPIKKFHYLKLALSGSATTVINHLPLNEGNYSVAWAALEKAYDCKRMLASAYLNQVLDYRCSAGNQTVESLKSFLTKVGDNIAAFKLLNIPDESAFILFYLASRCLDRRTREQFELAHNKIDFPTNDHLTQFVRERCVALELADNNINFNHRSDHLAKSRESQKHAPIHKVQTFKPSLVANHSEATLSTTSSSKSSACFICKNKCRSIQYCKSFANADVQQRLQWMKNWTGCKNCLSPQHNTQACGSKWTCKWCQGKHNSMLCVSSDTNKTQSPKQATSSTSSIPSTLPASGNVMYSTSHQPAQIVMGTVLADIKDARGQFQQVRIVIDSGSHFSFMTQRCAQKLGLNVYQSMHKVSGIGQTSFNGSQGEVSCIIKPRQSSAHNLTTNALVVKEITSFLPISTLSYEMWRHYLPYPLADPKFFESSPIDFLLGCDLFGDIWTGAAIVVHPDLPKVFPSIFGHVVIGKYQTSKLGHTEGTSLLTTSSNDISFDLQKFWELEEPSSSSNPPSFMTADELACETHFRTTHYRKADGSYVVNLPFKDDLPNFIGNQSASLKRYHNLEDKLRKNPPFRSLYVQFMREYEQLGHMSPYTGAPQYILPHHGVFKEEINSNKIRVVFDGSAKTCNGSLNDHLRVGPKLQADIRDILLNFRAHPVVFVTDITKFYRHIWVDENDCKFQCIYWRHDPSEALQLFKLETVTYGLSCSPYLSLRVLQQLNKDEGSNLPLASCALERDIYIDDLATGAGTLSEALDLQQQLISLLKKGNFTLSKWASNCPQLLQSIPESDRNLQPVSLSNEDDISLKILGLQWNPSQDCFQFKIRDQTAVFTKRGILSFVAKIYDPLGFLSPYVILLKGFMQELWKSGVDWDDPIPSSLKTQWQASIENIESLSCLRIPRFVCSNYPYAFQIIGFSDASMKSYCAALFIRIIRTASIEVHLLTAKTKLAPLKTISIPRLELCGAHLLAKIYKSISGFLEILSTHEQLETKFFTDSTIVLGWLNTPSYKLKIFVANRVSEILTATPITAWKHVISDQNPADCGSRGLLPIDLVNHPLWWSGPSWLALAETKWPNSAIPNTNIDLPELKGDAVLLVGPETSFVVELIKKFSSYSKLLRVIARLLRWSKFPRKKLSGPIKCGELENALALCVKHTQNFYFSANEPQKDIYNRFAKLNPFVDSGGLLRVGGRLYHSDLPYNHKHPILLPNNCHLALLILDHYHRIYLHPGPSLLQALVQTRFWIPSLRRLAQQRSFQCITCFKLKGQHTSPKMADLPAFRLKGERAFLSVGTDFAGPFILRESLRRKAATSKVYMCLFICLTTKAIHLEPVTSLSTNAFMAAFDRFVSRRGLPSEIVSDCGTNYVSASHHLKDLWKWFGDTHTQQELADFSNNKGINWRFNPPAAPHFGGIWEAGVKSAKRLIRRAVGDTPLTYEELCTLLSKCESVLNSRPLCPLSSDPSENDYLSPGHFLIGTSIISYPDPSLLDVKLNMLDRWQLINRMSQQFWHRWRIEYLSTLQSRVKWTKSTPNLEVGQLVLLKDPNTPILHWPLARIVETHPGHDGIVRVVTIQTNSSTYKRPVVKVVPLLPLSTPSFLSDDSQI